MTGFREPPEFRFGRSYEIGESGCWNWTRSINNHGYAKFNPSPDNKVYAHRWAYEYLIGPIPDGLEIDHLCRNTQCVNPAHLEPVTPEENLRRANQSITECVNGHEYTPANTYQPPGASRRQCKQCNRDRSRERARKRRAKTSLVTGAATTTQPA